jgi:hypothetical protein
MLHIWHQRCDFKAAQRNVVSHALFARCHTVSEGVNFVTIDLFSWTYSSTLRHSFILKLWNHMESILVNRNVSSELIIFVCDHSKTGMCLVCPEERRNTVFDYLESRALKTILYYFDQVFRPCYMLHIEFIWQGVQLLFGAAKVTLNRELRVHVGHLGRIFRDFRPKTDYFRPCYALQNAKVFSSVTPVTRYMNTWSK